MRNGRLRQAARTKKERTLSIERSTGPRTGAWDELWARMLVDVLECPGMGPELSTVNGLGTLDQAEMTGLSNEPPPPNWTTS